MNHVISVLLPSRGRPGNLMRSVCSVFDLAARRSGIEVLCQFDHDDPMLADNIAALGAAAPTATIIGSDTITTSYGMDGTIRYYIGDRLGYWRMHDYFNGLAARSSGEILINCNDDTEFMTAGWDALLLSRSDRKRIVQQLRLDRAPTADCTFPAIGRDIYETLGHLSLNAHCDAWISDVAFHAGLQVSRDDIVFLHHCLPDQTHAGKHIATNRANGDRDMSDFKGTEQTALRALDVQRLKERFGL